MTEEVHRAALALASLFSLALAPWDVKMGVQKTTLTGDAEQSDGPGVVHHSNHLYLALVIVEAMPAQLMVNGPRNYRANLIFDFSIQLICQFKRSRRLTMTSFMLLYSKRWYSCIDDLFRDAGLWSQSSNSMWGIGLHLPGFGTMPST